MLKEMYVGILRILLSPLLSERDQEAKKALDNLEMPMSRVVGERFMDASLNVMVDDLRQEIEVVRDWTRAMGDRLGLQLLCIGGKAMVGGESAIDARSPEERLSAAIRQENGNAVMTLLRQSLVSDVADKGAKD